MQQLNWNDLRYALALSRAGTIAGAARSIGVNETTVSRRLGSLERATGAELFARNASGKLHATKAGALVVAHAERIEAQVLGLGTDLGDATGKLSGTIRITSVPMIINRILAPALRPFLDQHPGLVLELIPEARNLNLSHRDADLALRLARPTGGGMQVKARRLGTLEYDVYAAQTVADDPAKQIGWITYEDALGHLPQARWLATVQDPDPQQLSGLRVADSDTAQEAAAAGLGKTLLPVCAGDADPRLCRIGTKGLSAPPGREIWLLSQADTGKRKAIRATISWIDGLGAWGR